jgi:V8-like Glu-specific endopeptidase
MKVIYGEDDRVDVIESDNTMFRELSLSTAAMISPSSISKMNSSWGGSQKGEVIISAQTLQQRGMCGSERFKNQPTAARCSGFLVGEDLLVTAGHCVTSASDCKNYRWVFNYKISAVGSNTVRVLEDDVYSCASIVEQKLSGYGSDKDDYALIKLDRKVKGIKALSFRKEGRVEKNEKLVVIGHPTGLPTKIADGAWVRGLSNKFFSANLDTYGGNSGSAVFNVETGDVEGILVRGARDYVYDSAQGCRVSNRVSDTYGTGEDVTYITNIQALKDL